MYKYLVYIGLLYILCIFIYA